MTYLIVIPAYNAAATIADVLSQLSGHRGHVLVVDDGSADGTADIARGAADEVIRHESNRGVGAALWTGIKYARETGYDRLVTLDSDGQHPPRQVEEFIDALAGNDLVVGSRFLEVGDGVHDAKLASNLLAALIVNDAFDARLADVACGYRAFWCPLDPASWLQVDGWGFLYEQLIASLAGGGRVATVPVPALYQPSTLWATRALEIEGFLAAMVRHSPDVTVAAAVGRAHRAVVGRDDFVYEICGQVFHCFYVGAQDCYLVQTDTKAARVLLSELTMSS
jgi:glycosyltransferase involved in cell wall biosynthesis